MESKISLICNMQVGQRRIINFYYFQRDGRIFFYNKKRKGKGENFQRNLECIHEHAKLHFLYIYIYINQIE